MRLSSKILQYKIFRISGHSMQPTLKSGQLVVAKKSSKPQNGDIIILQDEAIVKRVISYKSKVLHLMGDNPDSKEFIIIKPEIFYRVII